ncbi:transcriptional antiterminator NusG [Shouchella lonarensis]|uniref:Transcriptional antiterminator NusG n=1 Tax=Shouchella lonarensis TaxID=1464122 RepID=A0A1G6N242_9BACI|nr:transcriptional antiterminator NusG [Shouchella lonarensis]
MLKMTREGEEMGASEVYIKNSRIVVHAGPLKGLEGLIKKFNKRQKRVKVSLNFMGNVKEVDMDVELLSTLDKTIC